MTEKYFSFHGRLNRKPFIRRNLMLIFCNTIIIFTIILFAAFLGISKKDIPSAVFTIFTLPIQLSRLTLELRRLHDLNLSGWWLAGFIILPFFLILFLTPFILTNNNRHGLSLVGALCVGALAFYLSLFIIKGSIGPNDYGDDPLQPEVTIETIPKNPASIDLQK